MPETDELKIFLTNDPSRTVSVSVSELERLVNATRYYAEHGITCMQPTVYERTCHMLECHEWQDEWEPYGIYCSECKEFVPDWNSKDKPPMPKYCPNCGARVVSDHE